MPAPPSTWWDGDNKVTTRDGTTLLIEVGGRKLRQGLGVEEYSPHSDDLIGPEPGRDQVAAKSSVPGDKGTKLQQKYVLHENVQLRGLLQERIAF